MEIYQRLRANHSQYFPPGIMTISPDDIILDGGAYTGDTLASFVEVYPGYRNKYYAFEPDPKNYAALQVNGIGYDGTLIAIQAGIGSKEEVLRFKSTSGMDSAFTDEEAELSISVTTLDDFFTNRKAPTLIKMDVEGMELQALAGSERIIRYNKPKLAICVYHRPNHLWEIPLLVRELNPDYRFYLRHYSTNMSETVMYAV